MLLGQVVESGLSRQGCWVMVFVSMLLGMVFGQGCWVRVFGSLLLGRVFWSGFLGQGFWVPVVG